jgi:hypothetical protein
MQHGYIEIIIEGVKHAFYFPLGLWSNVCIKYNVGLSDLQTLLSPGNPRFLELLKDVLHDAARYNAKRAGKLDKFEADADDAYEWLGGLMRENKLNDVLTVAFQSLAASPNAEAPKETGTLQVTK